jgi:putative transposase
VIIDESGFSMVSPLKKTWAPVGETPMVKTSISHHTRVNVIGALLVSPAGRSIRLATRMRRKNMRGEQVRNFLRQVLRRVAGPVAILWDRHPMHKRKLVTEYLDSISRVTRYELPKAAPELNPAEGIWAQADEYVAGTAPKNIKELSANVHAALARTRNSSKRLRACLNQSDLPW